MGLLDEVLGAGEDGSTLQADPGERLGLDTDPTQLVTGGPGGLTYAGGDLLPENIVGQGPGGVYQDKTGKYVQVPGFKPQPTPQIQTLAQLVPVLKALEHAPDEIKTKLLSKWTGIPLTSQKVQQLHNTIAAARARYQEAAPDRARARQTRDEQLKFQRKQTLFNHAQTLDRESQQWLRLQEQIKQRTPMVPDPKDKTGQSFIPNPLLEQINQKIIQNHQSYDLLMQMYEGDQSQEPGTATPQPSQQNAGIKVTRIK